MGMCNFADGHVDNANISFCNNFVYGVNFDSGSY